MKEIIGTERTLELRAFAAAENYRMSEDADGDPVELMEAAALTTAIQTLKNGGSASVHELVAARLIADGYAKEA